MSHISRGQIMKGIHKGQVKSIFCLLSFQWEAIEHCIWEWGRYDQICILQRSSSELCELDCNAAGVKDPLGNGQVSKQ